MADYQPSGSDPDSQSNDTNILYSLVIPVYLNEASIPSLLQIIEGLQEDLGNPLEVIFVIDGSPDRSNELLLEKLPRQSFGSRILLLSRNFGSFAAIRAGLSRCSGRFIAVMAADLQEPISLIHDMYSALCSGECDVVVGVREARDDPALARLASEAFWAVYRRFVLSEIPPGGVDVFGCNEVFRDRLLTLEEAHSSLVAQIFWLGYRRKCVPYVRQRRQHGTSAWTLKKKIDYLMNSMFAFTDLPIRLLTLMGLLGLAFSFVLGAAAVTARLIGQINVPGYTATVCTVIFFGALNSFGLGVIGSYVWRTFENTKARPLNIIMEETIIR